MTGTIGKMEILVLGVLVRNIRYLGHFSVFSSPLATFSLFNILFKNFSQEVLLHEHMKHLHLVLAGQILQVTITMMQARQEIVVLLMVIQYFSHYITIMPNCRNSNLTCNCVRFFSKCSKPVLALYSRWTASNDA